MFATFKNAWKVAELRSKLLFTLLILIVYRLGAQIPVPFIDPNAFKIFLKERKQLYLDLIEEESKK